MKLRYVVARLVPDVIREEFINVGVILQADEWVACKFIERIPKSWDLPPDIEEDVATLLHKAWTARLAEPSEIVYLPEHGEQREVAHTDPFFLDWLQQTHSRHLQLSDMRQADIGIGTAFDFDTFLLRLYHTFVSPKPRPRKPPKRSRLHTEVRREFLQRQLPLDTQIRERDVIIGSFPWPIDFVYQVPANGQKALEVGIGLVDVATPNFIDKAKNLFATWVDVRNVRPGAVRTISVIGGVSGLEDQTKAIQMLGRYSDQVFTFERDKDQFVDVVAGDFEGLPMFTDTDMHNALRQVSRRITPSEPDSEASGT